MDSFYPIEIFMSRYGGVHEGGEWIACVNCHMPGDAQSDDCACAAFWNNPHAYIDESHPYSTPGFGVGATPETALENAMRNSKDRQLAEEETNASDPNS